MKKNRDKILSMILIICFSMSLILNTTLASQPEGESGLPGTGDTELDNQLKEIIDVLVAVAGLVCTAKLAQIGILYMMSTATERSAAKGALVPWAVGAIICGGYAIIGNAIIDFFKDEIGIPENVLDI